MLAMIAGIVIVAAAFVALTCIVAEVISNIR